MENFISTISKKEFPISEKIIGSTISLPIVAMIKQDHENFNDDSLLSITEYKHYKQKYLQNFLVKEISDITQLERDVIDSIDNKGILSDRDTIDDDKLSFAQNLSDKVAKFGGSWKFIIIFLSFIMLWMIVNQVYLGKNAFDLYPFILLNLVLSCIASLQAPVLMMSQNRLEEKDRQRAKQDYMINLKSELEIRLLHEKIDHLILDQQQELIKYQQEQLAKLNILIEKLN
jgi:uncharacterized membrane protein